MRPAKPAPIARAQTRLGAAGIATRAASNGGDRLVSYVLSDESVGRDGATIRTAGWKLDAYMANPVVLWAHDDTIPPIGKMVDIATIGKQLRGTVRYTGADQSEFADLIYRLILGGFVNAVSVGWFPIKSVRSTDPNRMGGIDFLEQELLEVSNVSVPALPTAIATARSAGIDTRPLFAWAERTLDLGAPVALPAATLRELRRTAGAVLPRSRASAPTAKAPDAETALAILKARLCTATDQVMAGLIAQMRKQGGKLPLDVLGQATKALRQVAADAKAALAGMTLSRSFNPDQPRDPDGKFAGGGGDAGSDEAADFHTTIERITSGATLLAGSTLVAALAPAAAPAAAVAAEAGTGLLIETLPTVASHILHHLGVDVDLSKQLKGEIDNTVASLGSHTERKAFMSGLNFARSYISSGSSAHSAYARAQAPALVPRRSASFDSFGAFLQAVSRQAAGHGQPDTRLVRAPTGAGEVDPTAGGFLVPPEYEVELLGSLYEQAVLAPLCDRRETDKPGDVRLPAIDETSRANGARWGGVLSYWLDEGSQPPATLPRFRNLQFAAKKLIALCVASEELLADVPALDGHMRRAFAAEASFALDLTILKGNGAGVPLGIIGAPGTITVPKETGQAAGTITAGNIAAMWSRLPAPCRKRAVWIVNEDAEGQLDLLGTASTAGMYFPAGTGGTIRLLWSRGALCLYASKLLCSERRAISFLRISVNISSSTAA